MRKVVFGIVLGVLALGVLLRFDFPILPAGVVGKYTNTNYHNSSCCAEAPHVADELELFADHTFTSGYYGRGTYKLSGGIFDQHILLLGEKGDLGYETYFTNRLFGCRRIMLNADLDHCYEKCD